MLKPLLLLAVLVGATPALAHTHNTSDDAIHYNSVATSFERAIALAKDHVPNARVVEGSFDDDNGGEYDITLYSDNAKHEVNISATSGQILKHKQKRLKSSDKQQFRRYQNAKISLDRAIGQAERATGGKVYAVDFESERRRDVYELKVATKDNQTYKIRLDAKTGNVIEKKLDD